MSTRNKRFPVRAMTFSVTAIVGLALVIAALLGAVPSQAQQPGFVTPTYVGTATSPSGAVVLNFLATLDYNAFNANAQVTIPTQELPIVGRDAIAAELGGFFNGVFTGTQTEVTHAYFMDNAVIVEFLLYAQNTGAFLDNAPTNLPVVVPMIGVFELENGLIQNLRLYFDLRGILRQRLTSRRPPACRAGCHLTPFSTPGSTSLDPGPTRPPRRVGPRPSGTEGRVEPRSRPGLRNPSWTEADLTEEPGPGPVVTEEPGPPPPPPGTEEAPSS